jgi:hypothetical protein
MDVIDCATSTFGSVLPTSDLFVTTSAQLPMGPSSSFVRIAQNGIIVPSGAGQTGVCGNDIALLVLAQSVQLPQYVTPAIQPPMTDHQTYTTNVTAIGYGINNPMDDAGTSAGVRRIKENVPLYCISNDKNFPDCLTGMNASQVITAGEFVSGDASTCEGDSGSSAFDQGSFDNGKWVSFGVLSRGGVSNDNTTCIQPIYTRFDAWGSLLSDAAAQAASAGGYTLPAWAGGPAAPLDGGVAPSASDASTGPATTSTSGAANDGVACTFDSDCAPNSKCVSTDNVSFVCASPCDGTSCPVAFSCLGAGADGGGGFCFPASHQQAQASSAHSGGCSVAGLAASPFGPWRPGAVIGLGLAAMAIARRRSR